MEYFGMLGVTIPLVTIGIITFFIVAIVQEGKGHERGLAIRQAFTTVIVLVMLMVSVVSLISLGQLALRQWVFTNATPTSYGAEASLPQPEPYIFEKSAAPIALLTCADKCDFTTDELSGVRSWLTAYQDWKANGGLSLTEAWKRNAVNAFSFLLVALPLYLLFVRVMNRDTAPAPGERRGKPTPLRSIYFYLVAFSGLVVAVISAALLINVGLKTAFGISSEQSTSFPMAVESNRYVSSVENCSEKCGFTTAETQLAKDWQADAQVVQDRQSGKGTSRTQGDLATTIPLILVTAPLFWYHFATIRREGQNVKDDTTTTV